jgi:hypothetical protein
MHSVTPHDQNDNPPEKACTGLCGRTLPATAEFFHRGQKNKSSLASKCKECVSKAKKEYYSQTRVKEHKRTYDKVRNSNPETHEHILALKRVSDNRPDVHNRKKQRDKDYRTRSGIRERKRSYAERYRNSPEGQRYRYDYRNRPDVKERRKALCKVYRNQPAIRVRIQNWKREYYSRPDVREKVRQNRRIWQENYFSNPEKKEMRIARVRNRRAKKNSIPGVHTPQQIQEQLTRQEHRCYYAACGYSKFDQINGKYIYHVDHTFPISRVAGTDIPANSIEYLVLACPACNMSKGNKFPWEFPEGGRLL